MGLISDLAGAGSLHSRGCFTCTPQPGQGDSWLFLVQDGGPTLGYRLGGIPGPPLQVLVGDSEVDSSPRRGRQIGQALAELRPLYPQVHLLWG